MRCRALAVSTAFLAACVMGSPTAHAAACNWVTTDLPVGPGVTSAGVIGGSDNGDWVVSYGFHPWLKSGTFTWYKGQLRGSFRSSQETGVADVNNSGVLMGNGGPGGTVRITNGVTERMQPAAGSTETWGESINNRGDVVGLSSETSLYGPVVVWPVGSTTPRELPDTRNGLVRFVAGIDDDGNVAARETGAENRTISRVWNSAGVMTELEPLPGHYSTYAEVIRNGRIFGQSQPSGSHIGVVVEWGLDGKIVRSFPEYYSALDANASGHVLGARQGQDVRNGVSRVPGEIDTPTGIWGTLLADNGDVYGSVPDSAHTGHPAVSRCG
ncbi:hypothetical protein SK803_29700 [Lentzea sp. BCCO 10_0856]|uniref:Extracellular repeat, HAF family n=1 Tax=Lentzea miocenica TaxID=3095431 RepID=A0ABU4T8B4_9PSEU|nr:hypothetical protein [Lentzea sp. BCCO 10_0856]MDX8034412.1 hypothetical protein [Lentzea sp. BCCO 10_0856]